MKRQTTDWEKIFVNHIFNKRLVHRIYKELQNSIVKKLNNMIRKWQRHEETFDRRKYIDDICEEMFNIIGH